MKIKLQGISLRNYAPNKQGIATKDYFIDCLRLLQRFKFAESDMEQQRLIHNTSVV